MQTRCRDFRGGGHLAQIIEGLIGHNFRDSHAPDGIKIYMRLIKNHAVRGAEQRQRMVTYPPSPLPNGGQRLLVDWRLPN